MAKDGQTEGCTMFCLVVTVAVGVTAGWLPAFFIFCAMWGLNMLAGRNVF